ncbi:MAG TPA: PD-(D/E)XK nuclease family protein [Candidatus Nanoarchaeia archaeon]|nr:PD-(D/E)XK nuclease family protein [Candidatus Nanoarchaeia archaeon]
MVIKNIMMNHGMPYFYRYHTKKAKSLTNGYSNLLKYLETIEDICPHKYFFSGPRSSSLRFKLNMDVKCIEGHEISKLAKESLVNGNTRDAHTIVELFLLQHDNNTVAVELPLWLEHDELADFQAIFNSKEPLTGHIDILRIENNNVWIWDYKPRAMNEKFAVTQTFFYALMLSKRTNIPLEKFRCGYFDSAYAFVFKPEETTIMRNQQLNKFTG